MRVDDAQRHPSTLTDYIAVVKRRKWVVITSMIVVPVAAYVLSMSQHKVFQSSAQVYISRQNTATNLTGTPDASLFEPPDRFMQTQVDLASAQAIAAQVVNSVHVRGLTVARLLGASSVAELPNSDVLSFTVRNANPALSRRLVSAYANAFTNYRRQLDTGSLQLAQKQVQARLAQMAKNGQASGKLYENLSSRSALLSTMIALGTKNTHVIQEPTGSTQVQPKPMTNLVLGIALGLILGFGLAFLLEALDSRVRGAEEISARLGGLPLLARLPKPTGRLRSKSQLPMVAVPGAPQAEAFRILRTQLDLARLEQPTKTIMVTSATVEEGKSTTAANLAAALARAGRRVILVDLDLYRPSLGEFFALDGPGVTDVTLGTAELGDALVPIPMAGDLDGEPDGAYANGNGARLYDGSLDVLPAGRIPPDSGDFMNTQALRELLGRLEERADTVIVDTSPMLQAGDAMTLSTKVDGLLLIVREGVVRRKMLGELARLLESTPATKLGFVLTDVPVEPAYGYSYRRGYGPSKKGSARQVTP
jgi:Mrp family chromosome partitioning ATPase/capsular polysaccharide biosynthesis protein